MTDLFYTGGLGPEHRKARSSQDKWEGQANPVLLVSRTRWETLNEKQGSKGAPQVNSSVLSLPYSSHFHQWGNTRVRQLPTAPKLLVMLAGIGTRAQQTAKQYRGAWVRALGA